MNFQAEYLKKLTPVSEAVKTIKSGDWVDYGLGPNYPYTLDKALSARRSELHGVNVRGAISMWTPEICKGEDAAEHFSWHVWHCSGVDRKLIDKDLSRYAPMRYSELPRFYRDGNVSVDVAMVQVTPMNADGYFSFALSASHLYEVLKAAKVVIVEVNRNMPWLKGREDTVIHVSEVDMIVEGENPELAQLPAPAAPTEVDRTVANLIVPQIRNGSCLQLGIGAMPSTIGSMIATSDLHDLSVHTEMYVDGFMDIALEGKITGRNKKLDDGKQVYAFAAGSQKLYEFMASREDMYAAPVDYTNDVRVIAQIDNFISINNAIECDLFGQINAESAGLRQISGTGGQLDFLLGAYLSEGGKSFICMSSTAQGKDGSLKSRILPTLTPGSVCTDPRSCTQYVVTEYGMVNLKGLSLWQRAEALISIAHPDFRESLIADAEKMGIWRKTNK
ncbi:MAG: butyryl-CoA:acetate CoA-transferase [Oscillospiraceae bacterium]|nr:butyryl-CoA:acetate CoA-transferase [Oscillospiraceae bacterium]